MSKDISNNKVMNEKLRVFDSLELEFGIEAIQYLANKDLRIEELVIRPTSDSMYMLIMAGVPKHNFNLAKEAFERWVKEYEFGVEDFMFCCNVRVQSNWGFFRGPSVEEISTLTEEIKDLAPMQILLMDCQRFRKRGLVTNQKQ